MKLETFQYIKNKGWSIEKFPDLDSEQTLILIFFSPYFINHIEPILELAKHYPKSKMIGCSSAGEILGSTVYDDSISIAIMSFDKTSIRIVKKQLLHASLSYQAGAAIQHELDDENLRSILVLSEGLNINGTELARGLNQTKKQIIVTGGLAADGNRFNQTAVVFNREILNNHVVAVGFYGEYIQIGYGSRGGWDVFGIEREITRSKNNILYELDNRPALEIYKEYLGDKASELPAIGLLFPLAIRESAADSRFLVRTILAVDEKAKSLTFAGDMPIGYSAQMMRANLDHIITGADEAAKLAASSLLGKDNANVSDPILSVAISCVGRRLLLGERSEEETEATLDSLPSNTQQIGFYAYGELSPYGTGNCDLHNQTMTLTTISEKL